MKKFIIIACFFVLGCTSKPIEVQKIQEIQPSTETTSTDTQVNYDTELMKDLQDLVKAIEEVHRDTN